MLQEKPRRGNKVSDLNAGQPGTGGGQQPALCRLHGRWLGCICQHTGCKYKQTHVRLQASRAPYVAVSQYSVA